MPEEQTQEQKVEMLEKGPQPEDVALAGAAGRAHFEHWLTDATLCVHVQGDQVQLTLVPVERTDGRPRHNHTRAVTTPLDLAALEQIALALAEVLAWPREGRAG